MDVGRGDLVEVTTFDKQTVLMRALSGVEKGRDFLVIWVCTEEEWPDPVAEGIPWPAEHVRLVERELSGA